MIEKGKWLAGNALPIIKDVYEKQGERYQNIVMPFTDGRKTLQIVANLKKAYESEGSELMRTFERNVTLGFIDLAWKDHLREMDDLKQSVHNAVYEQKDPLLIYKFESFDLFSKMRSKMSGEIVSFLSLATLPQQAPTSATNKTATTPEQKTIESRANSAQSQQRQVEQSSAQAAPKQKAVAQEQPMISEKRFQRNDKVTVFNVLSGEKKEIKFKQAEPLIETGNWKILEDKAKV